MNGMTKGMTRYEFPTNEINRYTRHGMARMDFSSMRPSPLGNGFINVGPLLDVIGSQGANQNVSKPAFAWVKRGPNPVIIVSSDLQESGVTESQLTIKPHRKSLVAIDSDKEVDCIAFHYCQKTSGNDVTLEPIYKGVVVKAHSEQPDAVLV